MAYVEFLRVRRALIVYSIVILACSLIVTVSLGAGHVRFDGNQHAERIHIPLTILFLVAAFGSLVFGTVLSRSLNRERATLALSWTRPVARERTALAYMLVDFGGVVVAFLITLALELLPGLTAGSLSRIYADPLALGGLLSMLGATVMWYGLVQAATSWYSGHAGLAYALSWGLFLGLIILSHISALGPIVQGTANALDYLNPLAYMSSYKFDNTGLQGSTTSVIALSEGVRTLASWSIGLAACAIAIFAWKRAEA